MNCRSSPIKLFLLLSIGLALTLPEEAEGQGRTSTGVERDGESCAYLGAAFRGSSRGLYLIGTTEGGPADQAGLRAGDLIVQIDSVEGTLVQLDSLVRSIEPGGEVHFEVARGNTKLSFKVRTGSHPCPLRLPHSPGQWGRYGSRRGVGDRGAPLPPDSLRVRGGRRSPPGVPLHPDLALSLGARTVAGIELHQLSPELAEYFEGADRGLLILTTLPGGPGARAGLRPGDVIVSVGGQRVETIPELREALVSAGGAPVRLEVIRRGSALEIEVSR